MDLKAKKKEDKESVALKISRRLAPEPVIDDKGLKISAELPPCPEQQPEEAPIS